jgi:AcrR family transcriptional regulator
MARVVDETKLERVHEATMRLIVIKGYGGASISSIAKEAQVSEGYLYRFYLGKEELVNVLLNTKIKEISECIENYLETHESAELVMDKLLDSICEIGFNNPTQIKFLYVMLASYNFSISEKIKSFLIEICLKMRNMGIAQDCLDKNLELEHFFNMMIIYPIQYINLRLKEFIREGGFSEKDKESLKGFVMSTLIINKK